MANEQRRDGDAPRSTDEGGPIRKVGADGAMSATTSTTDDKQPSALGGNVATRSGARRAGNQSFGTHGGEDTDGAGSGGMVDDRSAGSGPGLGGSSGA